MWAKRNHKLNISELLSTNGSSMYIVHWTKHMIWWIHICLDFLFLQLLIFLPFCIRISKCTHEQIQLKLQELSIKHLNQLGSWNAFNWIGKDKLCGQEQGWLTWLLVFGKIILMVLTARDTEESQNNLMAGIFV